MGEENSGIQEINSDYCIEPIYKILKQGESTENGIKSYKFSLTAGVKIYDKDTMIWKKGLQQEVSISPLRYSAESHGIVLNFFLPFIFILLQIARQLYKD